MISISYRDFPNSMNDPETLLKTRHRYQSFSQRISNIKADFTNSTELNFSRPKDEDSTFFFEKLQESLQSCLDPLYSKFVSKILRVSRTLSLIIHNEHLIFQALLEYLGHSYSECSGGISTVMDLITCLSRDIPSDFYPYFFPILKCLFQLFSDCLSSNKEPDTSFIENFYKCIFFLFKFLIRNLIDDLENVINFYISSFFVDKHDYVRRLAAETLAFLIRQAPDEMEAHRILFNFVIPFSETILSEESIKPIIPNDIKSPEKVEEEEDDDDEDKEENSKFKNTKKNKKIHHNKGDDNENDDNENDDSDNDENDQKDKSNDDEKSNIEQSLNEQDQRTAEEKLNDFIVALGEMEYYECRNVGHTLRNKSISKIQAFLCQKHDNISRIFVIYQKRIAEHIAPNKNEPKNCQYFQSLLDFLPSFDIILSLQVFSVWIQAKFICDSEIVLPILSTAIEFLEQNLNNPENNEQIQFNLSVLAEFLCSLNALAIDQQHADLLSNAVILLITNDFDQVFDSQLKEAKQIASYSTVNVLSYISSSEEIFLHLLPHLAKIIEWMHPSSQDQIPTNLLNLLNNEEKLEQDLDFRNYVIPLLGYNYIHSKESYEIMQKLESSEDGISLSERKVYYSLMEVYDRDKVIEQPPKLLQLLGENIGEEDSLEILLHFTNIANLQRPTPEWLKVDSDIFSRIFNSVSFHLISSQQQKTLSSLLMNFDTEKKEIGQLSGNELIIYAANAVFNVQNNLTSLKEGETWITRLRSSITRISNLEKLFDVILAFSQQGYAKFLSLNSELLGELIHFSPDYADKTIHEITSLFPFKEKKDAIYVQSLLGAFPIANFLNSDLIDLLKRYASLSAEEQDRNTLICLLNTMISYQKGDQSEKNAEILEEIDNITKFLLRNSQSEVRRAAFNVQFENHIKGRKGINAQTTENIKKHLEAFVGNEKSGEKASDKTSLLLDFQPFVSELNVENEFVIETAVNLSIGLIYECLIKKKRQKKKFKSLASTIFQSLSFLDSTVLAPLIQEFLPSPDQDPTPAQARQFCKFLIPMLSRIPAQISEYNSVIKPTILIAFRSLHEDQQTKKIVSTAATEYVNEFYNHGETQSDVEDFCREALTFLPQILHTISMPVLTFVDTIATKYPIHVASAANVLPMLLKLLAKYQHEAMYTLIHSIAMCCAVHDLFTLEQMKDIIDTFQNLLDNKKMMKSQKTTDAFIAFLEEIKPVFEGFPPYMDLCINFVLEIMDTRAVPLIAGSPLSDEQFSSFVSLIASHLEPDFRKAVVPIVAEHLGKDLCDSFIILNSDNLTQKTNVYQKLDAVGDFAFVFSMQAFADLQLNDFPLRTAAVGFLTRVISEAPSLVVDFILPTIERHLSRSVAHIPASEILILLQTISKYQPEIIPSIAHLAFQPFFLSLGSIDPPTASSAFSSLASFIEPKEAVLSEENEEENEEINENIEQELSKEEEEKDENTNIEQFNYDKEEFGKILLPLLCQMSTKEGVDVALAVVCKYSSEESINKLMMRLIKQIEHGTQKESKGKGQSNASLSLLISLCSAHAFPVDKLSPVLLHAIESKRISPTAQIKLITSLLNLNNSSSITSSVRGLIISKLQSRKIKVREFAIKALCSLSEALSEQLISQRQAEDQTENQANCEENDQEENEIENNELINDEMKKNENENNENNENNEYSEDDDDNQKTRFRSKRYLAELEYQKMGSNGFFELFQELRHKLKDVGYQPIMYVCFMTMLEHTKIQAAYDDFITTFVDVLFEDIFGKAAQDRTRMADRVPEAKKCVTFHSFELLAKDIDFRKTAKTFVEAIVTKFEGLTTMLQAQGARKLILTISNGFSQNESVDARLFVSLVEYLLQKFVDDFNKRKPLQKIKYTKYNYHVDDFNPENDNPENRPEFGHKYQQDLFIEKPQRSEMEDSNDLVARLGAHFLPSLMAVQMLKLFFDQELFNTDDPRQIELLNNLFEKLWAFVQSTLDNETLCVSLGIMNHYAINSEKFSHFINNLPDILQYLTDSLSKLKSASDNYGKAVFTLMTTIISSQSIQNNSFQLPTQFTRALVKFCQSQLDIWESCEAVFGILHLIMIKRQDIPEIYDIVDQVFELMIMAGSEDVRTCSGIFCAEFLTLYELSSAQVKNKFKFFLSNLNAPRATARRSILRFMRRLLKILTLNTFFEQQDFNNNSQNENENNEIDENDENNENLEENNHEININKNEIKFGITKEMATKMKSKWEAMLEQYAELMFLHLGVRLANETDDIVRKKTEKITGRLMSSVSSGKFDSFWTLMVKWVSSGSKQVRTGLLLLSVAVQYCSAAMEPLVSSLQQVVDLNISSQDTFVRLAAIELHRQMIAAYHDVENVETKLLPPETVIFFVDSRETSKNGCEIAQWYLSEYYQQFKINDEQLFQLCNALLKAIIGWKGIIKFANEALLSGLKFKFSQNEETTQDQESLESCYKFVEKFMEENFEKLKDKDEVSEQTLLDIIKVFVGIIFEHNEIGKGKVLKLLLLLIQKVERSEDRQLMKSAKKAMEIVRSKVDAEEFGRIWSEIIAEEEEEIKRKEEERAAMQLNDPEGYKALIEQEREEALIEMRKKKYMESAYGDVTLHSYGQDGKKVEPVPLIPELR